MGKLTVNSDFPYVSLPEGTIHMTNDQSHTPPSSPQKNTIPHAWDPQGLGSSQPLT